MSTKNSPSEKDANAPLETLIAILDTLLAMELASISLQIKLERGTISKKEASARLATQIATLKNLEKEVYYFKKEDLI